MNPANNNPSHSEAQKKMIEAMMRSGAYASLQPNQTAAIPLNQPPTGSSPQNLPGFMGQGLSNQAPGPSQPPPETETTKKKRYKRYDKPPYTYQALIALAIQSAPNKMLRLSQILEQIKKMFPFFQGEYTGWKESVRHNLSQCDAFKQVLRDPSRPQSKGNFWTVDINKIPAEQFRRQNTKVSRAVPPGYGYALDLRDIFDVYTGQIKIAPVNPTLHPLLRPLSECKPNPLQNILTNQAVNAQQNLMNRYGNLINQPNFLMQQRAAMLPGAYNNPFFQQNLQALAMQQQVMQAQNMMQMQKQQQQQAAASKMSASPKQKLQDLPPVPTFTSPKSSGQKSGERNNSNSSPTQLLPNSPSTGTKHSSSGHSNRPNNPSSDSNELSISLPRNPIASSSKMTESNLLQIQQKQPDAWKPTTICNMMPETPLIVQVINTECSSSPNTSPTTHSKNQPSQNIDPGFHPKSGSDSPPPVPSGEANSSEQAADDEDSSDEKKKLAKNSKRLSRKPSAVTRRSDWEKRRKSRQKRKIAKSSSRKPTQIPDNSSKSPSSPPAKMQKYGESTPIKTSTQNENIQLLESLTKNNSSFSQPETPKLNQDSFNQLLSNQSIQNILLSPQNAQTSTGTSGLGGLTGNSRSASGTTATGTTTDSQLSSVLSPLLDSLLNSPQAQIIAAQSPQMALKLSLCQQLIAMDKANSKPPPNVVSTLRFVG